MLVHNESMKKARPMGFVWLGMVDGKNDSPFKTIVTVLGDGKICPVVALKSELTRITDAEVTPISVISPYKVFSNDPNAIMNAWGNKPILFTEDAFDKFIDSDHEGSSFEKTVDFAHKLDKEIIVGGFRAKIPDYKIAFSEYFDA